jgi:hypothetical protein
VTNTSTGFNSGSESLDKHEPRDILHCHVERRDNHMTARLAWARARHRWRLHIWQHILFSDESPFSLRFSDGGYRVYRRRGDCFTDR